MFSIFYRAFLVSYPLLSLSGRVNRLGGEAISTSVDRSRPRRLEQYRLGITRRHDSVTDVRSIARPLFGTEPDFRSKCPKHFHAASIKIRELENHVNYARNNYRAQFYKNCKYLVTLTNSLLKFRTKIINSFVLFCVIPAFCTLSN